MKKYGLVGVVCVGIVAAAFYFTFSSRESESVSRLETVIEAQEEQLAALGLPSSALEPTFCADDTTGNRREPQRGQPTIPVILFSGLRFYVPPAPF